ncbi:MAG: PaaI family thioesterase [Paracoccaceae bacterium]
MTIAADAADPETEARLRASFAKQSLMATFGARIAAIAPGSVTLVAPILPGSRQQHGAAHAGLSFALGDTAAGYAALSLMAPDREVMTAEMKINLLAPALGERLIAIGTVAKPGRRLFVTRADVFAESGGERRLVAILQGTMVPVDPA